MIPLVKMVSFVKMVEKHKGVLIASGFSIRASGLLNKGHRDSLCGVKGSLIMIQGVLF